MITSASGRALVVSSEAMLSALLSLILAGPPDAGQAAEPSEVASEDQAAAQPQQQPPPPTLVAPAPELPPRRIHRCLIDTEPCYRTSAARLLLGSAGALATGTAFALVFAAGDRNRIGDPAIAIASGGMVAISGALIGGVAALLRGDGPAIPDRITPATLTLGFSPGGSAVTDERVPSRMSGAIAPTLGFPRDRGRLRLLAQVGGELGGALERDPRPQQASGDNGAGGTFATALESSTLQFEGGLDLAVKLPYPLADRSPWFGQFELRYKPLVFFAHQTLRLADGERERVSERLALAPLNLGFRWNLSPRQRFTFYLGPRWDFNGYGEPGAVEFGGPALAPIYGESWFDLDIPLQRLGPDRRAAVVGQLTVGYVHSRFGTDGLNFGPVVGFLGYAVTQFAVRVRPRDGAVAYQVEVGARAGRGINPYLRVGLVFPNIAGK